MSKERIVRATFSNGRALERGSVSRLYTHAYLVTFEYPRADGTGFISGERGGFSASEVQAHKNMHAEVAWARKQPDCKISGEVVPVEVIAKRTVNEASR